MRKKKKRIVVPTDQELSQYGGEPGPDGDSSTRGQAEPAQAPPANQDTPVETTQAPSKADQWKDKFLRAKAELANYQRRAEKDRSETLRYANSDLIKALLPILDDLERVIASGSDQAANVEALVDGVKLTRENFLKVLTGFHVSPIEAQGRPFDPQVHEAMMQQPAEEYCEPTVLQQVVQGYKLHDRVLRPSRVIVSKPPGPPEDDASQAAGQEGRTEAGPDRPAAQGGERG